MPTDWTADPNTPPELRGQEAFARKRGIVEELFASAGVRFPPAELLFRGFKSEKELEVWASSAKGATMERVATYGICYMSGDLGPKRREGDHQVPEGFYRIHYAWPNSSYHLELKIGYPNESDSAQPEKDPGGAVMIHGSCASLGCLAMSDERIEELWVMATSVSDGAQRFPVQVHLFPSRDLAGVMRDTRYEKHWPFWANLKEGLDFLDERRRAPSVGVDWKGRYLFR